MEGERLRQRKEEKGRGEGKRERRSVNCRMRGMKEERGNERGESGGVREQRVKESRETWEGREKAEAWIREDCCYCRGGPTATYMLHSYRCVVSVC